MGCSFCFFCGVENGEPCVLDFPSCLNGVLGVGIMVGEVVGSTSWFPSAPGQGGGKGKGEGKAAPVESGLPPSSPVSVGEWVGVATFSTWVLVVETSLVAQVHMSVCGDTVSGGADSGGGRFSPFVIGGCPLEGGPVVIFHIVQSPALWDWRQI